MQVRAVELTKVHGRGRGRVTALDGVSFEIAGTADVDGAVDRDGGGTGTVAVTGPSGSGKSTLLHLIGGLDRPTSGTLEVDGRDVGALRGRDLVAHRRSVGFVVQRYNLLPGLTALENVAVPLLPLRPGAQVWARARALLDRVGLGGRERALPGRAVGGEQQRVAIARALVGEPALVLADEPTGNLDSVNADGVVDLLLDIAGHGAVVVVATHDPRVAERCARRMSFADGRVVSRP